MNNLTPAEVKEIISFVGIGLLILAIALITVSRRFLKGFLGAVVSILAYISLIIGAMIVFFIVISGPTN